MPNFWHVFTNCILGQFGDGERGGGPGPNFLVFKVIFELEKGGGPLPEFFGTFSPSVFLVYFFTNANVLNSQLFLSSIFMCSSQNPIEQQRLLRRTSLIKQEFCL